MNEPTRENINILICYLRVLYCALSLRQLDTVSSNLVWFYSVMTKQVFSKVMLS